MQFNGEANSDDIISDITFWTDADTTAFTVADRTRSCNRALDEIIALILKSDGRWEFDDSNNSSSELLDTSIALVANTQKYAIPVTWLKVGKVRIKDSAGNLITLDPLDRKMMSDPQLTAAAGTPKTYDRLGNWIYLYPKPNYSVAAGLEVQYQKGASYFAASDTTKTPGFATHFHRLVPFKASLDYCEINDLDKRAEKIRARITKMESELVLHYSDRNADEQASISLKKEDFGASALV